MPEFGLGSHTFNELFGATPNPWDPSRSAGGSSGGAAVALALRLLPVADGSDFMGSLRNPAGWNHVFGMRPSQGRVPAWPVQDVWVSQLGSDGPMGRTVRDVAKLLQVQAGHDARVPLSIREPLAPFTGDTSLRGLRVGWLGDIGGHLAVEPGILPLCESALAKFEAEGAIVEPLPLGFSPDALWQAWLVWRRALVASRLAPFLAKEGARARIKPEALWEYDQAQSLGFAEFMQASVVRSAFHAHMLGLFERFDVLALPCAQVWPFPMRAALAEAHRRPRDGHLPPLDGDDAVRHLRRPACDQRAGGVRHHRALADGAAADRRAAGRCTTAGDRGRLRTNPDHPALAATAA